MGPPVDSLAAHCSRSARFWHAWLERGDGGPAEAAAVFSDAALCARLAAPLRHFEGSAPSSQPLALGAPSPLPARAQEFSRTVAAEFGVSDVVAEDLVRLHADEKLSGFPAVHFAGDAFELLDLGPALLPELAQLLHTEKCEALQVVACVLRTASDDGHPYAAKCRELSKRLLAEGLGEQLWLTFKEVASCPQLPRGGAPEQAEALSCVRQGLQLQLCALECLALAHYDPELCAASLEVLCPLVDLLLRQRFLGSLPAAAHEQPWLLSDAETCTAARCVGHLCLAVLLQGLALDDLDLPVDRHPLLSSVKHVQHLHRLFTSEWVDLCERAVSRRGRTASATARHCARMASLAVLGWAALLGRAPQEYREAHGLGLERIAASCVLKSPELVQEAVADVLDGGFLLTDAPSRQHGVLRRAMRSLVSSVATAFRMDGALSGIHAAMSELMRAVHEGEPRASLEFWRSEFPESRGCFFVLEGWFSAFPACVGGLLDLLAGLAGAPDDGTSGLSSSCTLSLLLKRAGVLHIPYLVVHDVVDVAAAVPTASGLLPAPSARVLLREPVYVEELVLRAHGLVLPEWHLADSAVLRPGAQGAIVDVVAESQGGARASKVRWELRQDQGVSVWRVAVTCWDAILDSLGWTGRPEARAPVAASAAVVQLLFSILRCTCHLLAVSPSTYAALQREIRADDGVEDNGLVARLLASFFLCAELPDNAGAQVLPLILEAMTACAKAPQAAGGGEAGRAASAAPPYATFFHLLSGAAQGRFRHRGIEAFVAVLKTSLDRERELGVYPTTLAAVELVGSLIDACPPQFLVLPTGAQSTTAEGGRPPSSPSCIETLGALLDFVFSMCFARCGFWLSRTVSERLRLSRACVRVATSLLPVLECFNWPGIAGLGPESGGAQGDAGFSLALRGLRELQLRALRSWSEAAFVPALVQCVSCDVVFGAAAGGAEPRQRFVGFRSSALEVDASSGVGAPEVHAVGAGKPPVTGLQLIVSALQCLHGVLGLALHPAGLAPHYAPLARHLLEVTAAREPLNPASLGAGVAAAGVLGAWPQRADLVQSLYAHICTADQAVAQWAASSLAAVCALWLRADLRVPVPAAVGGVATSRRALLLAFLSAPSIGPALADAAEAPSGAAAGAAAAPKAGASRRSLLSSHLAHRLLELLSDTARDLAVRCAIVDLARAILATQPGLFLDEVDELFPKAVAACGSALAGILDSEGQRAEAEAGVVDAERSRLLLGVLSFLDGLAEASSALVLESFSRPVEGTSSKHPTMWSLLLSVVTAVLCPLAKEGRQPRIQRGGERLPAPEPFLAAAAVFRLAERGCEKAAGVLGGTGGEAQEALLKLLGALLGPDGIALWLPQASEQSELEPAEAKSPARRGGGDVSMDPTHDLDAMRHPFGRTPAQEPHASEGGRRAAGGRKGDRSPKGRAGRPQGALAPFQECRASADRLHGLLAKHRICPELLSPLPGGSGAAGLGSFSQAAGLRAGAREEGGLEAAAVRAEFADGRCSVPSSLRQWADLCEVACGGAVDMTLADGKAAQTSGRAPLRQTLRLDRLGSFGTLHGVGHAHTGCRSADAYIVGAPLLPVHEASLQLVVGCLCEGAGNNPEALGDYQELLGEFRRFSAAQVASSGRVLAVEAFDDLAYVVARQLQASPDAPFSSKLREMLAGLLEALVQHLGKVLRHLDVVADHAAFFACFINLLVHLLAVPLQAPSPAESSHVLTPFGTWDAAATSASGGARELLQRETPQALALMRHLTAMLRICGLRLGLGKGLPPRAEELIAGAVFSAGHANLLLAALSLLLLLVPALKRPPAEDRRGAEEGGAAGAAGARGLSFEAVTELVELLGVLPEILDCIAASGEAAGIAAQGRDGGRAAPEDAAGAALGWPGRAPVACAVDSGAGARGQPRVLLLQSPEDAVAREAAETQARALDHAMRSGLVSMVLGLAERAIAALHEREGWGCGRQPGSTLGGRVLSELQRSLLPKLLSCSCPVFSPNLDRRRIALAASALGARPSLSAALWDRAVEAAWACQLDAVLAVLLDIAQTPTGAVLLVEQRAFVLLAYCPLLHAAVLPAEGGGPFPAAYAWPRARGTASGFVQGPGAAAPWRRPLHASWCRALLLVSTLLASAPQLGPEAQVFLEAYAPRLRHVFCSGLQIGHLAVLEEAALACRILAAMPQGCPLAEALLLDAATQAFAFVVGTCLSERAAPSEVFLPVAALERASAQASADGEAAPAAVPSVFHQRVEYLALDLLRSLLVALLRAAASPNWLSAAAPAADGPRASTAASPWGPWPNVPDVLAARASPSGMGLGPAEAAAGNPQRLWAVVMDFALEAARRVVDIMESLQGQRHAYLLVASASKEAAGAAGTGVLEALPARSSGFLIPLSCALAPLEPLGSAAEAEAAGLSGSGPLSSPSFLARGLTPPATPRSPSRLATGLSPPMSPSSTADASQRGKKARDSARRGVSYKHMGVRPHCSAGGQAVPGIIPECVSFADLRRLCSGILEMACTLLCHFCQSTRSSVLAGAERSMPGAAVLHGLLSFLHELRTSASLGTLGIDAEYLLELDNTLRRGQNLGLPEGDQQQLQHQPQHLNPAFDGDLWIPPAVSGTV